MPYCCAIPQPKGPLAVRHSIAVKRNSVTCIWTGGDIRSREMAGERTVRMTIMKRGLFLKISTSKTEIFKDGMVVAQQQEGQCSPELLKRNSPSTWSFFLEAPTESRRIQRVNCSLEFFF